MAHPGLLRNMICSSNYGRTQIDVLLNWIRIASALEWIGAP